MRLNGTCNCIEEQQARGRVAQTLGGMPRRGRFQLTKRVWRKMGQGSMTLVAEGVASEGLLALLPANNAGIKRQTVVDTTHGGNPMSTTTCRRTALDGESLACSCR